MTFRLKTHVSPELLSLALIAALAVITRLYQIGSFPYFPVQWPWLGDGPQYAGATNLFPGLYRDEASRLFEIALFPHALTTYEPSIQIIFEKVSMLFFGQNYFAYRLPSGIASTLTAVLVYLTAKQLYKRRDAALISGLFYIFMIPALIYGRMIFYENLVGLFLVATIFFIVKFENGGERRWLYLASLASAFAVLSKVDGLFVPAFFVLWAVTRKGVMKQIIPILIALSVPIAGGLAILVLKGSFQGLLQQWNFAYVGSELSYQFLGIQSMPSGYVASGYVVLPSGIVTFDVGYIRPEFWYLYGYVCLAALIALGSRAGKLLMEALFAFVFTMLAVWGMASYYLIMVFPVIALAAGGGTRYLAKLGTAGALALFTGFYILLVGSYIASSSLPLITTNYSLFSLQEGLLVAPIAVWLALEATSRHVFKRHFPFAPIVLVSFFALLLLGTPQLYSYYFLGRAP